MKMTIARALKEKNRIAGRIAKLQSQVYKYNKNKEGTTPEYDSNELLKSLQEEWAFLIDIKSKIAKANVGIADKLVMLTEAKAELQFWNTFSNTGPSTEVIEDMKRVDGNYVNVEINYVNTIPYKEVQDNINRVQKSIEDLQDCIDAYNANTQI